MTDRGPGESRISPRLVLPERTARELLREAERQSVRREGRYVVGRSGVQLWSGPFDGPDGTPGRAVQLGSVDWTYDTPAHDFITIHRAMTTRRGAEYGETPETVLRRVLALAGLDPQGRVVPGAPR